MKEGEHKDSNSIGWTRKFEEGWKRIEESKKKERKGEEKRR